VDRAKRADNRDLRAAKSLQGRAEKHLCPSPSLGRRNLIAV
jgi:hypothetical protein